MFLSQHFTLRELTRSQTAARRGIDNRPGAGEIGNLGRLCADILEPVRTRFGVPYSPTSGYRCARLNRLIGGAAGSQHLNGEAVDFKVPTVPNLVLARWIAQTLNFDQLILEFPVADDPDTGWVHCSLTGRDNRKEVLTRTRGGYAKGLAAPLK